MIRNELLAAARHRRALTAQQLADLVADLVQERTGQRPAIDADHVGRFERGLISWPNKDYREAFRCVLGVKSDAELGFSSRRSASQVVVATTPPEDVEAQLVAYAGAATLGVLDDKTMSGLAIGLVAAPTRIGMGDVEDLHRVINGMEEADHAAGGRTMVRTVAVQQLQWAQMSLGTVSFRSDVVRFSWMSAIARMGRLAGFMNMDAREHDVARRCFLTALQVAAVAEDWPSRVNILAGMARQAVHLNDGRSALKFVTLAKAGEAVLSATTKAMLNVVEARAYGVLQRPAEAVAAVRRAEELYTGRNPTDDPPWLWFYDEAQLYGDTGHALWPLAMKGIDVDAACRLRKAVDMHKPTDVRGRTFSATKLASLLVCREPGLVAYAAARESISAVAGLRSGRAQDELQILGRQLRKVDCDVARGLAGEVSATLQAARRAQ